MIRNVIEENLVGRKPLGRRRLRWEDCLKRDTEVAEPKTYWQEIADDRSRWQCG